MPTLKEERSASHASERRQNANRFANSLRCPTCNDGQRRRPCQRSRHRRVVPMEAACSDKPRRALLVMMIAAKKAVIWLPETGRDRQVGNAMPTVSPLCLCVGSHQPV